MIFQLFHIEIERDRLETTSLISMTPNRGYSLNGIELVYGWNGI